MRLHGIRAFALVLLSGALFGGCDACDRKFEPFVPGEQASPPDLRKIFPPGAEQAQKSAAPMAGAGAPDRGAPPMPPAAPGEAAASGAPIQGRVSIAPALASRAASGSVLFIIARRGASGPPVAVKRVEAPTFPFEFTLGPDDRMIKEMPFTGPLQLTARLDADGNATTRAPGDLQGAAPAPVNPGTEGVEIILGEVL
jgi:cytochrome c-type biogenesis protein CcmH